MGAGDDNDINKYTTSPNHVLTSNHTAIKTVPLSPVERKDPADDNKSSRVSTPNEPMTQTAPTESRLSLERRINLMLTKYDMFLIPPFLRDTKFLDMARFFDTRRSREENDIHGSYNSDIFGSLQPLPNKNMGNEGNFPLNDGYEINNSRSVHGVKCNYTTAPINIMRDSVIWVPKTREEWEDCSDEMTALCAVAAYRQKEKSIKTTGGKSLKQKSMASLSYLPKAYIQDRMDIDDPIRGFQIRHRLGGWLQGFILSTTFTTWTCYFKWDSLHAKSGMSSGPPPNCPKEAWDTTGAFSSELESQPRSGDPQISGVVWPTIAEISIVGAVGCGEYLLRMAINDIERHNCYDYIVLQATETSQAFYQKFGFCRVGAIARYLKNAKDKNSFRTIVGYRHWTYADEKHLGVHGGPSIMMAKKVIRPDRPTFCFLNAVSANFVKEKPRPFPLLRNEKFVNEEIQFVCTSSEKERLAAGEDDFTPPNPVNTEAGKIGKPKTVVELETKKRLFSSPETDENRKKLKITIPAIIPNTSGLPTPELINPVPPPVFKQPMTNNYVRQQIICPQYQMKNTPLVSPEMNLISFDTVLPLKTVSALSKKAAIKQNEENFFSLFATYDLSKTFTIPHKLLFKQKITRLPRSSAKPSFFNKVITPNNRNELYFVIHYDREKDWLNVVQMEAVGQFKGNRCGRAKYKAKVDKRGCNDAKFHILPMSSVSCEIVPAVMVTKTNVVCNESWDIL